MGTGLSDTHPHISAPGRLCSGRNFIGHKKCLITFVYPDSHAILGNARTDGQRDRLNLNGTAGLYSVRGVVKPSQIEPVPRVRANL